MTLRDRVEAIFRQRPGEWIPWWEFAAVGGGAAWRTRISELRTSMRIENRTTRKPGRTESEYRWVQ